MTRPRWATTRIRETAGVLLLAAIYIGAARAGLGIHAVSGFATLVWAPTGIALAALLLFGYRLWPGVFIGALVANLLTGAPIGVAAGIAAGNTVEALLGAYLLRGVGFRPALDRVRDVVALIVFAAVLSTAVSATVGVASLYFGGLLAPGAGAETWRAWWLGDLIGDLFVAPVLLVWIASPFTLPRGRRLLEAAGVAVAALLAAGIVFGWTPRESGVFEAYIFFPVLMWAAIRFGQRGAVSAAFVVSIIAIWGTAAGRGPFARPELSDSLLALQTFMSVVAATFLVLAATGAERAEATRELEQAAEDARQARDLAAAANRTKGEFLAVMSHELRTPLNAIFGFTDLLSMGVNGPLNEKQRETVDRIRLNQEHLLSLVDDLLSFARTEAGQLTFDIQSVRLADTLDAVEAAVERAAHRKSVALWRSVPDAALAVRADPAKLRQIVLNVVGNAVKFTPTGGRVSVTARREGESVLISVKDTGIGIPHDQLSKVFEPFFQVDSAKTRQHGGVGLGLAIARDLARGMGGDMRIESRVGEGTTVSILVPAG